MQRYNPKDIEPKWQKIWQETGVYTADLQSEKPKYFAFSMFNYPSGQGLHIGHAMNYTISDVKSRFKRQQGFESYHPVGWDSFGLPAENHAIKMGVSPQESMANIIPGYNKLYRSMGWSNDWEKEISTHLPEYYKWTQWLFVKMHEAGLAYQEEREQWWCTKCETVLADAQVIDDKCWRHDGADDPEVEKKQVSQWFFKITDYADELLEATDDLDWTHSVKEAQKNWIGKSEGAEIDFEVDGSDESIKVFTTRADTLFGVTFMVLAPEHELVNQITTTDQKSSVDEYVDRAMKKTDVERQSSKEKTGVFTGSYAISPINDEKIPIWVADYVLVGYGTGAIMAVPAHDERDFEFAKKYELEIKHVIAPQIEEKEESGSADSVSDKTKVEGIGLIQLQDGEIVSSGEFDGMTVEYAKIAIVNSLAKDNKAEIKTNYKMRDWSVTRQRYWGAPTPIVHCKQDCGTVVLTEDDLPVILPELDDFKPAGDGRSALARAKDWLKTECPKCGGEAERETDTLDTYVCSSWYMMRYLDPHNQQQAFAKETAGKWMPVDFYNGADHATAHLLYARFVTRFLADQGYLSDPEPFKQFLFNGKIMAEDGSMFSKSKGNGVDPMEIVNQGYGADALRVFLMFANPLEQWAKWNPQGVAGSYRFLGRIWNLVQEFNESDAAESSPEQAKQLRQVTAKFASKATDDIESNSYNTAIAACMEGLNDLGKVKNNGFGKNDNWRAAIEAILMCIAPFAPHMTEELWQQLGHSDSIHKDHWPTWDEADLTEDTATFVIQINGKVRAQIELPADAPEDEVKKAALAHENVQKHLDGKEIKKEIFIPRSNILSIVVTKDKR